MSIRKIKFIGKEAYELENEFFKVIVIPDEGSNIISFFDKKKQMEVLRVPKTKEEYENRRMLYGTPVLFPPNRIEDAVFKFEQRTYHLEMNRAKENVHIHGWVHDKKWKVIRVDHKNNILLTQIQSNDFPSILKQFPHSFVLEMTIELTDSGIIQSLKVRNESDETMPVGIGYHTTFHFPIEDSKLYMDVDTYWELNERHLPTGKLLDVPFKNELKNGMNMKGHAFDDVFRLTEDHKAIIEHPEHGVTVTYEAVTGFTHWVVFTAGGQEDLLAIEPYSWVTNAPNLDFPDEMTGLYRLKPNEEKILTTKISVEHI
ncbi:aldose 1-epimerase [Domibacillus epiphyticus]|uniref:Aldose 1-epimerase n=1 Tax=Domibacillus epiphyticus TaxID=1714355 RepID=A0A1V2A3X3_9BACI|nr:aldose 1-epimerase [Domibacillus epiphyticus]OMP65708.1 hypothetical protein BTO28_16265 [Domibacillus epiphyticus]